MAGISDVAQEQGYKLLIERPTNGIETFLGPFQTRRIDAAVITLTGVVGEHAGLLKDLIKAKVPFALLEQDISGSKVFCVQGDNFNGAKTATQKLLELGHRRIAFLGSKQLWPAVDKRLQGYLAALKEKGLSNSIMLESPDWTIDGGAAAVTTLKRNDAKRPSAILAGNDVLAIGAMHQLEALLLALTILISHGTSVHNSALYGCPLTRWADKLLLCSSTNSKI
jgi:DNA-binding LacI/PurR family transcriptional regulator